MTQPRGTLANVLAKNANVSLWLDQFNTTDLRRFARLWIATTVLNKLPKYDLIAALTSVLKDRSKVEAALRRSLPEDEMQVLAIAQRYGGVISNTLLMCEMRARGLSEEDATKKSVYLPMKEDAAVRLGEKFIFLNADGTPYHGSRSYWGSRYSYSDLVMLPEVVGVIQPAPPLSWKTQAPMPEPTAVWARSTAQVALDFWTLAQALWQGGSWKTNRGGTLPKNLQNRLGKLFADANQNPLTPPGLESLYAEILRGIGVIDANDDGGTINLDKLKLHLALPVAEQSWRVVRAWLSVSLWQDGIGVVPNRDKDDEPVRIDLRKQRSAREALAWALGRVAHSHNDWLDLETFLIDLHSEAAKDAIDFYFGGFSWTPTFPSIKPKEQLQGAPRLQAYWLEREGTWAANALLGTLAQLGLVERGESGTGEAKRYCFRLSDVGKAVFGAPEIALPLQARETHFLSVQPNHEVAVYLKDADASAVWPMAQMGQRLSGAAELVQMFRLTRESIYHALESGLGLEEIRRFLTEHSKTGLPANVARSLEEWGRRRESLVIRTNVSLGVSPADGVNPFRNLAKVQPIGAFTFVTKTAALNVANVTVIDHEKALPHSWQVAEDGRVTVSHEADAVALARLSQFTDTEEFGGRITASAVRRAAARGITAEQILGWFGEQGIGELPGLVATAIRNWTTPTSVFLGNLLMLEIAQPEAVAAILANPRFQPFLLGHIPPAWFVVRADKRVEMERALAELGFSIRKAPRSTVSDGEARPPTRKGKRSNPDKD